MATLNVVAISQDDAPHASVVAFLQAQQDHEPRCLPGPEDGACRARSGAEVLPTSVLFDANGKEVWRYVGDLDWTSAEAAKLLAEGGARRSRLSSRPSIAARPSAISAEAGEILRRQLLAEEQAAEQDRDRRDQQGDQQARWSRRRESISRK